MSIGKRKQARLEKWATAKDSNGKNVESLVSHYDIWIEPEVRSSSRSSLNGKTGLVNVYDFRFRYTNVDIDITGNWRLLYDRRYFKVHSINKENQNRFYYLMRAEAQSPR